ncbi:MAG: hypothetical protein SGPRY_011214, partial [Prymnesium sp.]
MRETLGSHTCSRLSLDVGSFGKIDGCNLTEKCFSSPSVDLWTTLSQSLDFQNFNDSYLQKQLDESGLTNGYSLDNTDYLRLSRNISTSDMVSSSVSSSSLGISDSTRAASIDSEMSNVRAAVSTASNLYAGQLTCADAATGGVSAVVSSLLSLISELSTSSLQEVFDFLNGGAWLVIAISIGFFGLLKMLIAVQM